MVTKRTFRRALDLLIPPFSRKLKDEASYNSPVACLASPEPPIDICKVKMRVKMKTKIDITNSFTRALDLSIPHFFRKFLEVSDGTFGFVS